MRKVFVVLCIISCWSCANMVSPTGGAKDVTPPQLVKSTPPLQTIYFDYSGFELEFDELIGLDNVHGQLIVSPPMMEKPDVGFHRRKVSVSFDGDDLLENTTYSFNFGNAIVDHNEGNILKNFSYVFSTGSYIDSLSIKGKVSDSFTEKGLENITVLLYRNLEDSMPLTSLPNYFDMSDENGNYSIQNIKEGTYKVFALEDMNQNYIYDMPAERIGFLSDFIVLDSSITGVNLNIFNEENELQYISDRNVEAYGKLQYIFNRPVENLEIILEDEVFEKDEYLHQLSPGRDTLNIWFPDYEDSFLMILKDDTNFIDTTNMELVPIYSLESSPALNITSNIMGKVDVNKKVDLNKTLNLSFDTPIISWDPSFISLHEDSLKVDIKPYFADSLKLMLRIPYKWKEGKKYLLMVGLGSFVNFYNSNNDIFEAKFGSQEMNYYGKIKLNIDLGDAKPPFIVQLLDKENNTIKEEVIYESKLILYDYLRPEEYNFRLVQDLNNNGKWNTGDYEDWLQPEPVLYYPTATSVRSNWDVELTWEVELKEY